MIRNAITIELKAAPDQPLHLAVLETRHNRYDVVAITADGRQSFEGVHVNRVTPPFFTTLADALQWCFIRRVKPAWRHSKGRKGARELWRTFDHRYGIANATPVHVTMPAPVSLADIL